MKWKSTLNNEFPEDGQQVLAIRRDAPLWFFSPEKIAKCKGVFLVAKFEKGISKEERQKMKDGLLPDPMQGNYWNPSEGHHQSKRSNTIEICDEEGNNLVPYGWRGERMFIYGQEIMDWMQLPTPPCQLESQINDGSDRMISLGVYKPKNKTGE